MASGGTDLSTFSYFLSPLSLHEKGAASHKPWDLDGQCPGFPALPIDFRGERSGH